MATSLLSLATPNDRTAMLRAMLAERFNLAVHFEKREQPVFDLVLARRDGRLGPRLKPIDTDCSRILSEPTAANATAPSSTPTDFSVPPPPCTFRTLNAFLRDKLGDKEGDKGDLLEGSGTIDTLAAGMLYLTRRLLVNKTNLPGSFAVTMNFDMKSAWSPGSGSTPESGPSVFTALQEQLGLKLQASLSEEDTLDRRSPGSPDGELSSRDSQVPFARLEKPARPRVS